ncbi:hypothetical protein CALCODRAFT_486451 [Calocera cornea HHB12733]|uniref:Arginyl-tRNA--protein transferase 1 n=1 Tax=Calocera cornea HHB12733 TaxID=1353952 RepID=A0A165DQH4_9BASI|nr:hypothetical protein CALCODRAFT_486451 [Calocera cornea HHB12733]
MSAPLSLLSPTAGLSQHPCGYCSPPGERSALPTSISYGIHPRQLSCAAYQQMLDRGWRRSGAYAYKPDMGRTCCPQYTIRLEAPLLKKSKSQKQALKAWNRFVLEGEKGKGKEVDVDMDAGKKKKHKGRDNTPFDLKAAVHASEAAYMEQDTTPAHKFEVVLELASFSEDKFALYQDYQEHVHKDEEKSSAGFKRFLCHSPLIPEPIPYPRSPPSGLPQQYGSYHQKYIFDGELIALGVIDILPSCVSSVYFMYSSRFEQWGMGKISALREAMLAREMHEAGLEGLKYLYMGYYIHTCQKMRYKGDYSPSFLLDPEEYTWYPIASCLPLLDKHRYVSFAHPPEAGEARQIDVQKPIEPDMDEALDEEGYYDPLPRCTAGCEDPSAIEHDTRMKEVDMVLRQQGNTVTVGPVTKSKAWRVPTIRRMLCDAVATLGWHLSQQVVFSF